MDILPANAALPRLTLTSAGALQGAWKVGQVLQATVLQAGRGAITLDIGGAPLRAHSQAPLATGQAVALRVLRTGELPVLQVLPEPSTATAARDRALALALPRQGGLPPLLANLAWLAKDNGGAQRPAAAIARAAGELFASLPRAESLTNGNGIKEAVQNSGLFLEARLARPQTPASVLANDLKAGLLRLLNALNQAQPASPGNAAGPPAPAAASVPAPAQTAAPATQAPPAPPLRGGPVQAQAAQPPTLPELPTPQAMAGELRQQVEQGLARLQLGQIASTPPEDGARPQWILELPVRSAQATDVMHLRITRDDGHGGGGKPTPEPIWRLSLAFDFEELGAVRAAVALAGEQVSVTLVAEREATAEIFARHLASLGEQLRAAGLEVGRLDSRAGNAAEAPASAGSPVLDLRA